MDINRSELRDWMGDIDVYLFDQLLKGRIGPGQRVLDLGCGSGRNLVYLARTGVTVFGVDTSSAEIDRVRKMAAELAPSLPANNFRIEAVERMSFADESFDVIICTAVLHFAANERHFHQMLDEAWRVLRPGGLFFARLASSIGLEDRVELIQGRRHRLPDGTDRFLVDEAFLVSATERLGGVLVEPIKTVNVQNQRCMTNWCVRKSSD
jgi:SAM-dependent methyltransferase